MKAKRCLSLIVFLFFTQLSFADKVPESVAAKVAVNTYFERCDRQTGNIKIDQTFVVAENDTIVFYIFNFQNPNKGFVIVSADDAVNPVLGYSFENDYETENHPPQFDYILDGYKLQILDAIKNEAIAGTKTALEWERLSVAPGSFTKGAEHQQIGPLIQTKWNQGSPYNELCPSNSLVGCVAVAMGQILKYWSHPVHGEGSHSYYHYNYGTLSADFGATTYEYGDMPHSINQSNIPIATLLYHCGVSVNMNYSPTASGAPLCGDNSAEDALKDYFRFDPDLHWEDEWGETDSSWQERIFHDIDNYRPIIYSGSDFSRGAAHAWNLDGYEAVGDIYHFHMNWGWGGYYNGYYSLDDLTPGSANYNWDQQGIFNIFPFAAQSADCYSQSTNYWTGSTNDTEKTQTSLVIGYAPEDGWMMFDISAIPDGAEIYSVLFNGYLYEGYKPEWALTPVTSDPLTAIPAVLHADIVAEQDEGYYYSKDESYGTLDLGWRRYMLEGDADTNFKVALSDDQFVVGMANRPTGLFPNIRFHGWNEENPPFIRVFYAAYGTLEGYVTEYGSGLPVENVIVSTGRYKDTTDADGFYHINNVPTGNHDILFEANGNTNAGGNPYFDQTISGVVITDGATIQTDIEMIWAELETNPAAINKAVTPGEVYTEGFTITNNGPGNLDYQCFASPPMGDLLMDKNFEQITGDYVIWGCAFDGTYVWVTGTMEQYGEHNLYKFNRNGELLEIFPQGTTSSMGMKKMTFDGTWLYSYDDNGFYRINPENAEVETMFTEFQIPFYNMVGLTWVPGWGFITTKTTYQVREFFVFDEEGNIIETFSVQVPGNFNDLTYDSINNCLWFATSPRFTYMQFSIETMSLTGLEYLVPPVEGINPESLSPWAACFTVNLIEGKTALAGLVHSPADIKFFALELETWLRVGENTTGVIPGESKGTADVQLKIVPGVMTEPSKTADVVIVSTAGANDTLPVTITNNFTNGTVNGTVTRFGTSIPITGATVTIDGLSDVTDDNGFYQIENIPIGSYPVSVTSGQYLDTVTGEVPVSGPPYTFDIQMKWVEMEVSPPLISVNMQPESTFETSFSISNAGPGNLSYNCEVIFSGNSQMPEILVVDRDLSCYDWGWGDNYADEWPYFHAALDSNNYSYTYYEVTDPWDDGPDLQTMEQYELILWFTGEAYRDEALSEGDQDNLAEYLDDGGAMLLSSADYLGGEIPENKSDWEYFYPGDFQYDYLGLIEVEMNRWHILWWNYREIKGAAGSVAEGMDFNVVSNFNQKDQYIDAFWQHNGTNMLLAETYTGWDGPCAIQYETNNFKTVFSSVSLGNVQDESTRADLIARIMNYLNGAWLEITSNSSGTIPGGAKGSAEVGLKFDAKGREEGTYHAGIIVHSNAPGEADTIPVTLNVTSAATVNLTVFLEGPFDGTAMDPAMCQKGLLPLAQPYNQPPWNYQGTESVEEIPSGQIVDWVLIDFRDAADAASATPETSIRRQAAFLLSDGSVVGLDGVSPLLFSATVTDKLFIAVYHRNHLPILSANEIVLTEGVYPYNFSTDVSQVYGGEDGYKLIGTGVCGMVAGDGNADGTVDATDRTIWLGNAGQHGFFTGDYSLDGETNNIDKAVFWHFNRGKQSQVPE